MVLEDEYAERLLRLQTPAWKRILNVQAPYKWNLRRLRPGRMLDVGCGIGRNLSHVPGAVGVDPNEACVAMARRRGYEAYTPGQLAQPPASFDSVLIAHVLEHLTPDEADSLARDYLGYLKPGGQLILITPQERTFAMDATHIWWVDFKVLHGLVQKWGLKLDRSFSFPFPRWTGKFAPYNEFVVTARKPA